MIMMSWAKYQIIIWDFVRWYLFLPPSTLGKNRNIKKIKNTSDLVKLLTSTVIALKTPPRLEKERAPQRKRRPLHRLKNLGGILRILLGSKPQKMQLSSGSAKMQVYLRITLYLLTPQFFSSHICSRNKRQKQLEIGTKTNLEHLTVRYSFIRRTIQLIIGGLMLQRN